MSEETIMLERYAFGRHIARLREQRGMSRAQLGDRAQLSTAEIEQIEAGEASLTLETMRRLAGGLDVMLSVLFEGAEDDGELRRLVALLQGRAPEIIEAVTAIARVLVGAMDKLEGD